MNEYVSGSKASAILGVHQRTLYLWDEKKLIDVIRTPGGKRLYNVKKYLAELESNKDREPLDDNAPKRVYNLKKKKNSSKSASTQNGSTSPDAKSPISSDESDIIPIKMKPLTEVMMSREQKSTSINHDIFDPSPLTYKRRIDPIKKQNVIFAQNPSQQLIDKYPDHTILSGDTSLNKFLDLIISNKVNQIVIDKSNWNIDSYNMLLYLINKFSDGTIIGENNVMQGNDSTDMQTFMKMMSGLINRQ